MRSRKRLLSLPIAFAAILVLVLGGSACQNPQASYTGKVEKVTVGMEATAVNSLIYLAADQRFFAANGLDVTIKDYPSGLAAVNGVLKNEVDVATAAEFVIVGKALARESIRTFTSIDKFLHNYVIARKDRGIETIADLKGKKIGVPLKTAAEFYLGRFLDLRGQSTKQVSLVDVPPAEAVDAIANGAVDAIIAWQPNAKAINDRLGGEVVVWPAQNEQATYCAAISTGQWLDEHPELIDRFLRSLAEAETYYVSHPGEARGIVQKTLGYDDGYIAAVWPEHQLSLSLDQSLVLAMEDQARWMIRNNLTGEKTVPNFLDYIHSDVLKALKPGAVNIIR